MRAVVCSRFDGIESLELIETADPVVAPGQVLVVTGRHQMKPALPFVPGTDAAAGGVGLAAGARGWCDRHRWGEHGSQG